MSIISSIHLTQQTRKFNPSVRETISFSFFPQFAFKAFAEIEQYAYYLNDTQSRLSE